MINNSFKRVLFLFVFSSLIAVIVFLLIDRDNQIFRINNLEKNKIESQKLYNSSIKLYEALIEKNRKKIDSLNQENIEMSIQGFKINDESISVEELLNIVNNSLEENIKLKNQVENNKLILEYIEESYGIKVTRDNKGQVIFTLNKDSSIKEYEKKSNEEINKLSSDLEEKNFILNNLQKRYGFKYVVKTEGNKIKSTIYTTKLDSALWLFPHYKHKIKQDKEGNTYVK